MSVQHLVGHGDDAVLIVGGLQFGHTVVGIERQQAVRLGGIGLELRALHPGDLFQDLRSLVVILQLAVALRQPQGHLRILRIGGIALGENLGSSGVILVVERRTSLSLINFRQNRIGFFQRSHIAVEFCNLGRFRQIGDRFVVLALSGSASTHILIAGRQILLRRFDAVQFGGIFRILAIVNHFLEQCGRLSVIPVLKHLGTFVVRCDDTFLRRYDAHREESGNG